MIKVADPGEAYRRRATEIDTAVRRVLDSGWYILGREVEQFENEFAAYLATKHAVGVGSGTDGLQLALRALSIGPGDAVATVSHTAVATVAAIEMTGAVPLLVDVDPLTFTMDPNSLETAINQFAGVSGLQVKAVMPVHLYGRPADMTAIQDICSCRGLRIVEDCSQAHGATYGDRKVGTLGDIGVFSLYPTKNLGALGDAGIVCCNDDAIAERLRLLREYGWRTRNFSEIPGVNSRLDEIQAGILRVRLKYLDDDNAQRRAVAAAYNEALSDRVRIPQSFTAGVCVYHQYVVRVAERDRVRDALAQAGVQTLIHYPAAIHQQPAYLGRLPLVVPLANSELVVRDILSLPMNPELQIAMAHVVAERLNRVMSE